MNVMITGWSGVGKSTIYRELLKRGCNAFDTDQIEGLCHWLNVETGERFDRDYPVDFSTMKFSWEWDKGVLRQTLASHKTGSTFYCGNATNAFDFYSYFDAIFVLDLAEAEQRRRMMTRTEHDFGKDSITQDVVIDRQKTLAPKAVRLGAIKIDASPPPAEIVETILQKLEK